MQWVVSPKGVSDTLIVYTLILSDQVIITVGREVLVIMAIILMTEDFFGGRVFSRRVGRKGIFIFLRLGFYMSY